MATTTPRQAIVKECRICTSNNPGLCSSPKCNLFPYKHTKTLTKPKKTPIKAIKAHCLECTGDNALETKNCTGKDCPLYPYRLGKMPNMKRKGSELNVTGFRFGKIRAAEAAKTPSD